MHTSIRIDFVICNNAASDRRINLFDRLQHARYEYSIVVASVYKRLNQHVDSMDAGEHQFPLDVEREIFMTAIRDPEMPVFMLLQVQVCHGVHASSYKRGTSFLC
jgi:hypothetical protein